MKIYEFSFIDKFNWSIPQILEEAKIAAKRIMEVELFDQEYKIEDVEIEGLPVAKDDVIVYHIVVKGKLIKGSYENQ